MKSAGHEDKRFRTDHDLTIGVEFGGKLKVSEGRLKADRFLGPGPRAFLRCTADKHREQADQATCRRNPVVNDMR